MAFSNDYFELSTWHAFNQKYAIMASYWKYVAKWYYTVKFDSKLLACFEVKCGHMKWTKQNIFDNRVCKILLVCFEAPVTKLKGYFVVVLVSGILCSVIGAHFIMDIGTVPRPLLVSFLGLTAGYCLLLGKILVLWHFSLQ